MRMGGVAMWVAMATLMVTPWRPGGVSGGLGLQLVESSDDSGPRCPRAPNCTCSDTNYIELICPVGDNIITMKYLQSTFMDLICEHQTPTNYAQLPELDLGSSIYVKTFSFKMCPLPTSPFIDVINRAGVSKLNILMFQAFGKNLTNTLHRSHLKGLGGVTRLTLSSNGLTDLPDDLFEDMTNLTWLELRSNNIRAIRGAFAPLVNLEFLQLASNELPSLPDGVFSHLRRLRRLHLWQNRFTELHGEAFKGLDKLTELDLGSNAFTTFPEDVFSSLNNLEKINLYNNNFSFLPENLFAHNKNLTDIMLYYNRQQLKTLPDHFLSDLPKLREVYLYSCELEVVPETIFKNSPEIRNISLNNNHISIIPPNLFADQKKLLTLDLNSNRIKYIPNEAFRSLINLEQLNLDTNAIEEISRDLFSQMGKLRMLTMQNNKLHHIHDLAFTRTSKLNHVNMAYNQLNFDGSIFNDSEAVEAQSPFRHLPELSTLEYLNMSHNVITEIYSDWRILLSRLAKLDLSCNVIKKLEFNDIYFISSSVEIDLSNNNISEIDFGPTTTFSVTMDDSVPDAYNIYSKPAQKIDVFIENNPIKCDCLLHDFVQYLRGEIDPRVLSSVNVIPGKTTCASPPNLEGDLLTNLYPLELTCPLDHLLNGVKCPERCTCNVRLYDSAVIINCSHSSVKNIPMLPNITGFTLNHTELHMEGNHIRSLVKDVDYANVDNAHITKLFLANNNITDLTFFGLSHGVEVLDLRNNTIRHVNSSIADMLNNSTSLKKLWISGNPIECECSNKEFLLFMQNKYKKNTPPAHQAHINPLMEHVNNVPNGGLKYPNIMKMAFGLPRLETQLCRNFWIQDFSAVKCLDNSKVSTLTIGSLCGAPPVVIAATVLLAIVCLVSGVAVALYYKYNHEIKVFLFSKGWFLFWLEEEELDKDKVYDAFISFSHKDEEFVVNQLMPELEKGPNPFKICIHFRNWVAGEFIPTQIARSVEESRRTIVVLSPNFLESVWGKMEFRAAHSRALKEGRSRVIVILYGDIGATDKLDSELQAYLTMNTYVKWGDPWFWHNLRYALPHPSSKNSLISNPVGRKNGLEDKLELINRNSPTTPPAQNTPPAHQAHTNPLMEHVNNVPNGGLKYPNIMSNGMITMNGLKVNGNAKQSDV